ALVEAARLVDAHAAGHAPRLHRLLEVIAERLRALLGAAPAGVGGVAPVHADEHVNVVGLHTLRHSTATPHDALEPRAVRRAAPGAGGPATAGRAGGRGRRARPLPLVGLSPGAAAAARHSLCVDG